MGFSDKVNRIFDFFFSIIIDLLIDDIKPKKNKQIPQF